MENYHDPCPTVGLGSDPRLQGGIRIDHKRPEGGSVTVMLRNALRERLPAIYKSSQSVVVSEVANADVVGKEAVEAFKASKEIQSMLEVLARREGVDRMNVSVSWKELSFDEREDYKKGLHSEQDTGVLGCRNPAGVICAHAGGVVHIDMLKSYERLQEEVGALAAASALARLWKGCNSFYPSFNALRAIEFCCFHHWMGENDEEWTVEEYIADIAHDRGIEPEQVEREKVIEGAGIITREMLSETYGRGFMDLWDGAREEGSTSGRLYNEVKGLTEQLKPLGEKLSRLCVTDERDVWHTHYLFESIGAIYHVEREGAEDMASRMCDEYVEMRYQSGDTEGGVFQQGVEATKRSVERAVEALITYMRGLGLVGKSLRAVSDEQPRFEDAYYGGPLKAQPATAYLPVDVVVTAQEGLEGRRIGDAVVRGLLAGGGELRSPKIGATALL